MPDLRIFLGTGSGCGSVGAHGAFTGVFVLCSCVLPRASARLCRRFCSRCAPSFTLNDPIFLQNHHCNFYSKYLTFPQQHAIMMLQFRLGFVFFVFLFCFFCFVFLVRDTATKCCVPFPVRYTPPHTAICRRFFILTNRVPHIYAYCTQ